MVENNSKVNMYYVELLNFGKFTKQQQQEPLCHSACYATHNNKVYFRVSLVRSVRLDMILWQSALC